MLTSAQFQSRTATRRRNRRRVEARPAGDGGDLDGDGFVWLRRTRSRWSGVEARSGKWCTAVAVRAGGGASLTGRCGRVRRPFGLFPVAMVSY